MSIIKYRPEIDGLRAIAIIPVLIFHLNPNWLPGGFTGVDVFFVISGYLITSIILTELKAGTFSFRSFWERRLRRIFPALAFMLLSVLLFAFAIGLPHSPLSLLGRHCLRVLVFISNNYISIIRGDYWGPDAELIPLLHTWSLAVEEQFYFFLPPLIFCIFFFSKKKWALPILLIITLASLACCIIQTQTNQPSAFYLLPSRAWELLTGSILALIIPNFSLSNDVRMGRRLADIGLLIIVAGYFLVSNEGFPGWMALLPVVGTFLYIAFSSHGGRAAGLLSSRPIVFIGRASYSLYLWHWPALVMGRLLASLFELPSLKWWGFGLSVVFALASYLFVEPFGKKTKYIWQLSVTSALLIACFAFLAAFNGRTPDIYPLSAPQNQSHVYETVYANLPAPDKFKKISNRPPLHENQKEIGFEPKVINDTHHIDIVVLGDSHALMWGGLIEKIALSNNVGACFWTARGAPPFMDDRALRAANLSAKQHRAFNEQKIDSIRVHKPKVVILSARLDAVSEEYMINGFNELLTRINQISPSTKIVIIGQPPILGFGDQKVEEWIGWRKKFKNDRVEDVPGFTSANQKIFNQFIETNKGRFPNLSYIVIADLYQTLEGRVTLVKNGGIVYVDDDHLSEYGTALSESRLRTIIEPFLK